jgi:hypothetical protein
VLILAAYSISCLPVPFGFLQVEASAYFGQICSLGSTIVLLRASALPLVSFAFSTGSRRAEPFSSYYNFW